jgi:hypothetical protein
VSSPAMPTCAGVAAARLACFIIPSRWRRRRHDRPDGMAYTALPNARYRKTWSMTAHASRSRGARPAGAPPLLRRIAAPTHGRRIPHRGATARHPASLRLPRGGEMFRFPFPPRRGPPGGVFPVTSGVAGDTLNANSVMLHPRRR